MRLELLEDQIVDGITGCPVLIDHERKGSQVLMIGRPADMDTMRLIAASPVLLAALEELVSHLRPLAGDDSPYMDILIDAEAAIRAATGEGE